MWLDFEITDEAPGASALDFGVYAPAELLYTYPESSGIADTLDGILLAVEESSFRFVDAESLEERAGYSDLNWHAGFVDLETWYGMFPSSGVDICGYASRTEYDVDDADKFKLYLMDGELWFAEIENGEVWFLCRLEKADIPLSDIVGRMGPYIPDNETLREDSSDGTYYAKQL